MGGQHIVHNAIITIWRAQCVPYKSRKPLIDCVVLLIGKSMTTELIIEASIVTVNNSTLFASVDILDKFYR